MQEVSKSFMDLKRVQGSKHGKGLGWKGESNKTFFVFLKVVIAVDVLMETGNEFLQLEMPPSRFFLDYKVFFWYQKIRAVFGGQVAPKCLIYILVDYKSSIGKHVCIFSTANAMTLIRGWSD